MSDGEDMRKVLIDGDGCPVVDSAVRIAREYGLECIILCDTSHFIEKEGARTVTVSRGPDSVDFVLVNMLAAGDLVITQDYGLAAMCLARGAQAVSQNGMVYDDNNIGSLLMARHTARKIRNAGGRLKGSGKRQTEMDNAFEEQFRKLAASESEPK
jgi:uncharacterized protein YaiI (UPF0178 family)